MSSRGNRSAGRGYAARFKSQTRSQQNLRAATSSTVNVARKNSSATPVGKKVDSTEILLSAEDRFRAATAEAKKSVERFLAAHKDDYSSSSSDEELDADIINKLTKKYSETAVSEVSGNSDISLGRTQQYLENSLRSGNSSCLICIQTIKHIDPLWSCTSCYTSFHLHCIQRWAKDRIYQQDREQDENSSCVRKDIFWTCPKCRCDYSKYEIPSEYRCFCGKQKNPPYDRWLVPHTCGEACKKSLQPECGHKCLLPCHPGPCPPCPSTVQTRCYCGKQPPTTRRCSARDWSCNKPCGRLLGCGEHRCPDLCHPKDCRPCSKESMQNCDCGDLVRLQPCEHPSWKCDKICNNILSCGNHVCGVQCHRGPCGECPLTGPRTCPCGKSVQNLPCNVEIPTCGDTCGKKLDCNNHVCMERCHKGPCGMCLQMTVKRCRCGARQKEVPCQKEYLCENKCKQQRDCGRHACGRKCCDGECPPCEQVCRRPLNCGNHKCESICHQGPCYPCDQSVDITCRCGASRVTVPCGHEKITKPPKCKEMCKRPPNCHHVQPHPHRCHFGDCPPCQLVCDKDLGCGHTCPEVCHSNVCVKVTENRKIEGPWDKLKVWYEMQEFPCPPCQVPVYMMCMGEHESIEYPCSEAGRKSCNRICGRVLKCRNHVCEYECHFVDDDPGSGEAGANCQICEEPCTQQRDGCRHRCPWACHQGDCPSCNQSIRMKCHCGVNNVFVPCREWTAANPEEREMLASCKGDCWKERECGHPCNLMCHSGDCLTAASCKKKVKLWCKCKTKKKDVQCCDIRQYGNWDPTQPDSKPNLPCSEKCKSIVGPKNPSPEQPQPAPEKQQPWYSALFCKGDSEKTSSEAQTQNTVPQKQSQKKRSPTPATSSRQNSASSRGSKLRATQNLPPEPFEGDENQRNDIIFFVLVGVGIIMLALIVSCMMNSDAPEPSKEGSWSFQ